MNSRSSDRRQGGANAADPVQLDRDNKIMRAGYAVGNLISLAPSRTRRIFAGGGVHVQPGSGVPGSRNPAAY